MEQIRNSDGSIHQMKQPLLLSPWTDISPSRHPGSEGLEDECREAARRRLAEISARQKLLGSEAVPEFEVVAALAKTGRLLEPSPLSSVGRS
jgi:hypothetical protein